MNLLIATHNAHKTEEIAAMLDGLATVTDLTSDPDIPPADETGTTFEANATIKAVEASEALPPETLVLSDDSGLEVDPLGGAPGVYSARYAGENATDADNREKLLHELAKVRLQRQRPHRPLPLLHGARPRWEKDRSLRWRCRGPHRHGGER